MLDAGNKIGIYSIKIFHSCGTMLHSLTNYYCVCFGLMNICVRKKIVARVKCKTHTQGGFKTICRVIESCNELSAPLIKFSSKTFN